MNTWYRVTDPLNPLCGCDVRVETSTLGPSWLHVVALRRVDVFLGDRPFQLFAPPEESLGVMIRKAHLEMSPIQDDVVQTATDRPHGICIDESEMTRADGVTLCVVHYERATQIAVKDSDGRLLATHTDSGDFRNVWEQALIGSFETGNDVDEIVYALRNS